jgi:hypothetical protein
MFRSSESGDTMGLSSTNVRSETIRSEPCIETPKPALNQSYDEFANGEKVYRISYPSNKQREEAVRKALSENEFDYHLLFNNCGELRKTGTRAKKCEPSGLGRDGASFGNINFGTTKEKISLNLKSFRGLLIRRKFCSFLFLIFLKQLAGRLISKL